MVSVTQTHKIILEVARNRKESGLCLSHFAVLAYLHERSRYCSVDELAAACGLSYHQIVGSMKGSVLNLLLKRGLINTIEGKGNARNWYQITLLGIEVLNIESLRVRDFINNSVFT